MPSVDKFLCGYVIFIEMYLKQPWHSEQFTDLNEQDRLRRLLKEKTTLPRTETSLQLRLSLPLLHRFIFDNKHGVSLINFIA